MTAHCFLEYLVNPIKEDTFTMPPLWMNVGAASINHEEIEKKISELPCSGWERPDAQVKSINTFSMAANKFKEQYKTDVSKVVFWEDFIDLEYEIVSAIQEHMDEENKDRKHLCYNFLWGEKELDKNIEEYNIHEVRLVIFIIQEKET